MRLSQVQRHFEGPIELLSRKKDKRRDRRIPVMLLTCRLDSIPFDQLIDLVVRVVCVFCAHSPFCALDDVCKDVVVLSLLPLLPLSGGGRGQ